MTESKKAIGPPLRAGPTVKFQCFIAGAASRAAPLPLCSNYIVIRAACATKLGNPAVLLLFYLVHLVPSDQSMDLSGRMMPSELKVPPALMVMSLVSVASAVAPFSPLICNLLPD
jgi:hypothetical protein